MNAAENSVPFPDSISIEKKEEPLSKFLKKPQPEQDIASSSLQDNENSCNSESLKSSSVVNILSYLIFVFTFFQPL